MFIAIFYFIYSNKNTTAILQLRITVKKNSLAAFDRVCAALTELMADIMGWFIFIFISFLLQKQHRIREMFC